MMKNAEESRQITKARRKLKKRLEVIDRQFTPTALQEVADRMHSLLQQAMPSPKLSQKVARKAGDKKIQKSPTSAQASQTVNRVREQLVKRLEEEQEQVQSLLGRVSVRKLNDSSSKK